MTQATSQVQGLPGFCRHITTHTTDGVAVFETPDAVTAANSSASSTATGNQPSWFNFPTSAFGLAYATATLPADFNANADLDRYHEYLAQHPGITISGGSVLRVVDMAPRAVSPMHRTISLDYGVVLEGEIELELDSGETRRLPRGDIFVQRGTTHLWRNPSDTQPVRLLLVHLDSKAVVIEGKGALVEFMG